jgi:hypothetical protein
MLVVRSIWWLATFPFRLVLWVVGLILWTVVLPVRLVLGFLGLIGLGRLLQLGVIVGLGYFLYRLVSEPVGGREGDAG